MRFFYGVLLSILVHYILVLTLEKAAPYFETKPERVAEIEIIETPKAEEKPKNDPSRQIVRQALAPEKELKEDDEDLARFLSETRQRVRKESQAAVSGMTKNREQGQKQNTPQQKRPPQQARQPAKKSSDQGSQERAKDYDPDNIIARTLRENPRGYDSAPSTMGDAVPQDVSIGSFTALNTDRYVYYSFFARIEDLVRYRWESRVREAIDGFDRGYVMGVVGQKNWVTGMDIWLTPDGRFHSAHLMKESGIKKFDAAVASAFREAGMFPNPPQEMVEEDGYIHLKYSFSVSFRPSSLVYQQ
jgi:TonB family protein